MTQDQRKSTVLAGAEISVPPADSVCQVMPTDTRLRDMPAASNSIEPNWDSQLFEHLAVHGTRVKTKCPNKQNPENLDNSRLSRRILRVLRHVPEEECLSMDRNGWVQAEQLTAVIGRWCSGKNSTLQADYLSSLNLQLGLEHRVQFDGQLCRASYGHSTRFYKPTTVAEPNEPLYHGTSAANLPSIELFGLWPMRRRFVQLTTDFAYAQKVAARSPDPIVLQILREQAMADGLQFISTGSHVWLAEPIPAHLLMGWLTDVWDLGSKQSISRETDLKENRR